MARTATQAVLKRTLFISYDPSFVAKISKAEKSSKRIVDVSRIWD